MKQIKITTTKVQTFNLHPEAQNDVFKQHKAYSLSELTSAEIIDKVLFLVESSEAVDVQVNEVK